MWWQHSCDRLPAALNVCSTTHGHQQLTACHHSSSNRRQCALSVLNRPKVNSPQRMSARFKSVELYASQVQQKPCEKLREQAWWVLSQVTAAILPNRLPGGRCHPAVHRWQHDPFAVNKQATVAAAAAKEASSAACRACVAHQTHGMGSWVSGYMAFPQEGNSAPSPASQLAPTSLAHCNACGHCRGQSSTRREGTGAAACPA